jgi:hypothetical protein
MNDRELMEKIQSYYREKSERTPRRDPGETAARRREFLEAAETRRQPRRNPLRGWLKPAGSLRFNRGLVFLSSLVLTLTVILQVVVGTAFASRHSLPHHPLYRAKVFSEDLRIRLASRPKDKIQLLEQYTGRRVEELRILNERQNAHIDQTVIRMEGQTADLAKLVIELPEDEARVMAVEIHESLQVHLRELQSLDYLHSGDTGASLEHLQSILSEEILRMESASQSESGRRPGSLQPRGEQIPGQDPGLRPGAGKFGNPGHSGKAPPGTFFGEEDRGNPKSNSGEAEDQVQPVGGTDQGVIQGVGQGNSGQGKGKGRGQGADQEGNQGAGPGNPGQRKGKGQGQGQPGGGKDQQRGSGKGKGHSGGGKSNKSMDGDQESG